MHADITLDGHCTTCQLRIEDIARVDALIEAGKAESLCQHPCGHSVIYRSVGMWTAVVAKPATPVPPRALRSPLVASLID